MAPGECGLNTKQPTRIVKAFEIQLAFVDGLLKFCQHDPCVGFQRIKQTRTTNPRGDIVGFNRSVCGDTDSLQLLQLALSFHVEAAD